MKMRFLWLGALTLAVAAAAAGLAYATSTGSAEIHGCVNPAGLLRIPDTAGCRSNETALDWSSMGKTGATGPTGPAGPAGATGPAGPMFGSGTFESNGAPSADGGAVRLELLTATGTVVGRTNFSPFRSTPPFGGDGDRRAGRPEQSDIAHDTDDVPTGTYTLRLMVSPNGNCTPPENTVTDGPTLTYLLLDA